jgi:hypothetical protein
VDRFGGDRCKELLKESQTDFKYLSVEFFCLLEEALASFGVFVKYVVLQPVKKYSHDHLSRVTCMSPRTSSSLTPPSRM